MSPSNICRKSGPSASEMDLHHGLAKTGHVEPLRSGEERNFPAFRLYG